MASQGSTATRCSHYMTVLERECTTVTEIAAKVTKHII
jgi:hypothetical protein